jgi:hypothetical protein
MKNHRQLQEFLTEQATRLPLQFNFAGDTPAGVTDPGYH